MNESSPILLAREPIGRMAARIFKGRISIEDGGAARPLPCAGTERPRAFASESG